MRPVRFVALSEDGQALVLADEVGRLLALPIDDRVAAATRRDRSAKTATLTLAPAPDEGQALSPRDIQARIRAGESADDVARMAGVPVDRVLRYAGPVLQERAMLAQHARRTKLKNSEKGASLAQVVDDRLAQHGIDSEKISWDAYRRDDGTWRVVATWPSGKATAQAVWELDKSRQTVSPYDDMARYLCAERPLQILGQDPPAARGGHALPGRTRSEPGRLGEPRRAGEPGRDGEPGRGGESRAGGLNRGGAPNRAGEATPDEPTRGEARGRDPIRAGRDALLASLDRPLTMAGGRGLDVPPVQPPRQRPMSGGAAALLGPGPGSPFEDDRESANEAPPVPSLAVLRPRRSSSASGDASGSGDKPRKRLPSWDDVLFGSAPATRETS